MQRSSEKFLKRAAVNAKTSGKTLREISGGNFAGACYSPHRMIFLRSIERLSGEPEGYTASPFANPRLVSLRTLTFTAPITFFTGETGSGQSTLLEAIALRAKLPLPTVLPPDHDPALASVHTLARSLTLHWAPRTTHGVFLRACDLRTRANAHADCFELLRERCVPGGLHLLDTPECVFPPQRQLALLGLLKALAEANAQFIIATHSPLLLAHAGAQILDFDGPEITPRAYDAVAVVKLMREFLRDPEAWVRKL
jgi:predicted ATPase